MSDVISLTEERLRRRPQPVRCSKCSGRMTFSEGFVASDGRPWKIYRCAPCKNFEWKAGLPQTDSH
jgi:DNA-directed RNA polymerase subunit RPC12/RpoP